MPPPIDHAPPREAAGNDGASVPDWSAIDGLVCGFGDRAVTAPPGTILLERQVHGTCVVDADAGHGVRAFDPVDGLARIPREADALVARRAATVVGVRTADCVPILLVAPRAHWAAAVHAGWRGTLAGIAREAVGIAAAAGIDPRAIHAALGPSIGPCCYEVSHELGEEFARAGLADAPATRSKPHLDLRAANRLVLERCGVPGANIVAVGPCTRCARDRYHSFRAEPEAGGRQVSWIGWCR